MRVSGSGALRAPAETVWAALADREVLLRAFPCIDRLDVAGNGRYEFAMAIPIAAVSGTYSGEAVVSQANAPRLLEARVSAAGVRGTVDASLTVRLEPGGAGGTEVSYEADAQVAGPIAGIGQLLLTSVAKRLAADFLAGLDGVLVAGPAAPRPAQRPAEQAERPAQRLAERPAEQAERLPEGRDQQGSAVRTGLVVGAASGLAGMLIGALLGRRSRAQAHGRR